MPCFKPLDAWQKVGGGVTFTPRQSNGNKLKLPCGRCIGCRLDHGQMWASRMLHELLYHDRACFITLTYSDENLPANQSLSKRHLQGFFKRLRKHVLVRKIRYYACGEYGDATLRPHYHAIIFGWEPDDVKTYGPGRGGSKTLETIWGLGLVSVGPVNYQTCAYTARYVTKKVTGPPAASHYERMHRDTGEVVQVLPEFALMSRRPGIGARYFDDYGHQLTHDDFIVVNGSKAKVPRYYDKLLERQNLELLESKKALRKKRARKHRQDNTPERLAVREECSKAKLSRKPRKN